MNSLLKLKFIHNVVFIAKRQNPNVLKNENKILNNHLQFFAVPKQI